MPISKLMASQNSSNQAKHQLWTIQHHIAAVHVITDNCKWFNLLISSKHSALTQHTCICVQPNSLHDQQIYTFTYSVWNTQNHTRNEFPTFSTWQLRWDTVSYIDRSFNIQRPNLSVKLSQSCCLFLSINSHHYTKANMTNVLLNCFKSKMDGTIQHFMNTRWCSSNEKVPLVWKMSKLDSHKNCVQRKSVKSGSLLHCTVHSFSRLLLIMSESHCPQNAKLFAFVNPA